MKNFFSCLSLLITFSSLQAQYKIKFLLIEKTAIKHDSIYVSGSFNNWDSLFNKNYLLKRGQENERFIVLDLPAGEIEYKFHRGNWANVEMLYDGNDVADRVVIIHNDTTLIDSVESWQDQMIVDKLHALAQQTSDTGRVRIFAALARNYGFTVEYYNRDSAFAYAQRAYLLQQKLIATGGNNAHNNAYLFYIRETFASLFHAAGNYPKSLQLRLENLKLAGDIKDKSIMAHALATVTDDYIFMKDYINALYYAKQGDSAFNTYKYNEQEYYPYQWNKYAIVLSYYNLKKYDSALYYLNQMQALIFDANLHFFYIYMDAIRGDIYAKKENTDSAFYYYRLAMAFAQEMNQTPPAAQKGLAQLFQKQNRIDSALYYARLSLANYEKLRLVSLTTGEPIDYFIADVCPLLAELYKANGQMDSAYYYLHLSVALKDSLYNADKIMQFQTLTFNEVSRKQQIELQAKQAKEQYDTKIKTYGLITGLTVILIIAFILFRNNRQKQKTNALLLHQKQKVESTLLELQSTQAQLIQSEKMASLGELTAGIAHEIQNPLNFVNNFSEVNNEMIDEATEEIDKGNYDEVRIILNDIKDNSEKINHHGKRADAIVKGMLQHSRQTKGIKESTDINALCDEYLRLSYHGLRAKDKEFNADFKTDFDESIGKINIVPQDIGRVLLNLFNNAFYAVNEKQKLMANSYQPLAEVKTRRINDKIEITVSDNGNGIPQNIIDKIFQPFFTTKPTGQGTGLGLSLAYDIITKEHNGTIKVESKEGEGTSFIIQLPIT